MQSSTGWYRGVEEGFLDDIHGLFHDATIIIHCQDSLSSKERDLIQHADSLEDILLVVQNTKEIYDRSPKSLPRKWLAKLSKRICYYGNIMDVLVQQHPEYVSLVWGTMKMLFVLVENHSKAVATLAESLTKIADSLPRTQLSTILYPTAAMKKATARLYSCVIRFLLRAFDWYQKKRVARAWQCFTHPAELQYADLIEDIKKHTKEIDRLATGAAQAEQRDIHIELKELSVTVHEMYKMMQENQVINSSAALDTNQRLTDLQLDQILGFLSTFCKQDPMKSLSYVSYLCKRHASNPGLANSCKFPFWLHPKFIKWDMQKSPSIIFVKGDYQSKLHVRSFSVNLIHHLRHNGNPVIWTIKTVNTNCQVDGISVDDIFKDLTYQSLRLYLSSHNERDMALRCAQFRSAETLDQWIELLAKVLGNLRQLYVLVDIEAVDLAHMSQINNFSWISAFQRVLTDLKDRGCKTDLKIVIVSYGSAAIQEKRLAEHSGLVVSARSLGRGKRYSSRSLLRVRS